MRRLALSLASFAAAAALSIGTAQANLLGANLLTNPGFENGDFSGWTVTGNLSPSATFVNTGSPHSGDYSAAFTTFIGDPDTLLSQTIVSGLPGRSLTIRGFLFNTDTFDGQDNQFRILLNGVALLTLNKAPGRSAGYVEVQALATASDSDTITFAFRNVPAFFRFDDALVDVPEPATLTLLGAGLAVLVLRKCGQSQHRQKSTLTSGSRGRLLSAITLGPVAMVR